MKPKSKPQPLKAQEGPALPSCAHSKAIRDCKVCQPRSAKVVDLHAEKKKVVALTNAIQEKFVKDPKTAKKAAHILTEWLYGKK